MRRVKIYIYTSLQERYTLKDHWLISYVITLLVLQAVPKRRRRTTLSLGTLHAPWIFHLDGGGPSMILNQVFIIFLSCFYFMFSCFHFPCGLVLKMIVIKLVRTSGTIAWSYRWSSKVLIISVCFRVVGTTGQYGLLDRTSSRRRKQGSQSNNGTTSRYGLLDRTNFFRNTVSVDGYWYGQGDRTGWSYHYFDASLFPPTTNGTVE